MGLNDSFGNSRGQILKIDPLPLIFDVVSLIAQEERQRCIGSHPLLSTSSAAAFSHAPSKPRLERSIFSHYGVVGHTLDRCYKLHWSSPRYRPKPKNPSHMGQSSHTDQNLNAHNSLQFYGAAPMEPSFNQNFSKHPSSTPSSLPAAEITMAPCVESLSHSQM